MGAKFIKYDNLTVKKRAVRLYMSRQTLYMAFCRTRYHRALYQFCQNGLSHLLTANLGQSGFTRI